MSILAIEGITRLARERDEEQRQFELFSQEARHFFDLHADGVGEGEIVAHLMSKGASRSVASACADELLSGGLARKNWTTGHLSHPSHQ